MEKRKIIKFGATSHVVTLPNEWMNKHGLQKGNELFLSIGEKNLVFSIISKKEFSKAIINLDDKPFKLFNRELISYYLKNYKFIEIKGKSILDKIDQIKVFQEKLSSVEIVEIDENKILLKDLTSPNELNLKNILGEIVEMEKMLFSQLLKPIEKEKKFHRQNFINQIDSNINKLTFLAYKSINYNLDKILDQNQVRNSIHYWRIISALEQIGDILKRIFRYLKNFEESSLNKINDLFIQIQNYYDFITFLLNSSINLENNLKLYLDKKQSLLREIEKIKEFGVNNLSNYLVVYQLFKDILGQLDIVVLSITDLRLE